jgi:CTP:molybdopterin cytidylyltransferase MocA
MGRAKALLPLDGATFVERAVRSLRDGGCRGVLVVVGTDGEEIARHAERAGARTVLNPEPEAEPIASIRLALRALEQETGWAAILPVDHPLVRPTTVAALLAAAASATGEPIVCPAYRGVSGHPGLFPRRLFDAFFRPDLPLGAHSVLELHRAELLNVPLDDPGVASNVNTPADYRRFVEGCC